MQYVLTDCKATITEEDVQTAVDGGHLPMIKLLINHCKDSSQNPEEGEVQITEEQLGEWLSKVNTQVEGFKDKTSRYQEVKDFLTQNCSHAEGRLRIFDYSGSDF